MSPRKPPKISSWQRRRRGAEQDRCPLLLAGRQSRRRPLRPGAGTNTGESLPLASIFKLYVLYAVRDAIKAGTVSWDDQLTVTEKGKAVGSSMDLPVGAHISVRTAAEKMIATSDNMATDMLIGKLGPAGHRQRAGQRRAITIRPAMTPFPTMYELFSVGWGNPDLREQWKHGTPASPRRDAASGQFPCLQTGSVSRPRAGL